MRDRRYTIACLSGDGIGPEVMAEASRALEAVSHLHGFRLSEWHVAFAGDAVRRFGRSLPASTREACHTADAILIALTREPALDDLKAELDLTWRLQRVLTAPKGDLVIINPLAGEVDQWTVERAFQVACTRRAHVTSVGVSPSWREIVAGVAERNLGVVVRELSLEDALLLLAEKPAHVDVVVTEPSLGEALSSMAAFGTERPRVVASGRLSQAGPGIFGPTHDSALDIAGQGVANPSGMLLAVSLMLGEGLGERAAARTLAHAVAGTLTAGVRTPDMVEVGEASTTKEFMDVLLAELPGSRADTEFFAEVR